MTEPEIVGIDGTVRKAHYGEGKQPWDVMKELGWAEDFAAANVLKYIMRHAAKNGQDDLDKARWYWDRLGESKFGQVLRDTLRRVLGEDINYVTDAAYHRRPPAFDSPAVGSGPAEPYANSGCRTE